MKFILHNTLIVTKLSIVFFSFYVCPPPPPHQHCMSIVTYCFLGEYFDRLVSPAEFYNVQRINKNQFNALQKPLMHKKIGFSEDRKVKLKFKVTKMQL
jgi:hypothetical protein